ncbi:uncharacterized protein B0T23DRAFT_367577 [Neurospora hispaniola]|uniref:Uncharacterized protein n=1 Tax=Neurospora hispaniola TaxID=588809 RepID=A0AAJ0HZ98_9PEZI|nr:hypothetical protein B0T23DRAFT_367577 [Neurospora hispaniola]
MKTLGLFALSGAALLQGVSAACCRSNKCLKAVALADTGLADCSANLGTVTVTSTAAATTSTQTVTTTVDQVTEFTSTTLDLFTETTTETALTETLFYTETVTSTGPVQTDTVTRTLTQTLTTTSTELAPGVTSTATYYLAEPTVFKVKARRTVVAAPSTLPEYASADCADWTKYVKACKCVGVELATVTATVSAAVETEIVTVTVPGEEVTVTVPMTVSSTQTAIVSATATDASTVTETVTDVPDSVTITETVSATSTVTVTTTSTPSTVVPLTCQPTGYNFLVSTPYTSATSGVKSLWLWGVSNQVLWVGYGGTGVPSQLAASWTLDSNGSVQWRGTNSILYVSTGSSAASVQVKLGDRNSVDAGVAAGSMARIKGCVDANTGQITVSADGRHNLVQCGSGIFISSGNGSDAGSSCVQATPTLSETWTVCQTTSLDLTSTSGSACLTSLVSGRCPAWRDGRVSPRKKRGNPKVRRLLYINYPIRTLSINISLSIR